MTCFLSWVISFSFLFLPLNAFIILFSGVSLQGSRFGSFFHHACTSWALFISGGCFMPVVFWTWVLWGPLKPPAGLVKIQTARSQPKISETASLGWTPRICISSLIIVSMLSCLFSWVEKEAGALGQEPGTLHRPSLLSLNSSVQPPSSGSPPLSPPSLAALSGVWKVMCTDVMAQEKLLLWKVAVAVNQLAWKGAEAFPGGNYSFIKENTLQGQFGQQGLWAGPRGAGQATQSQIALPVEGVQSFPGCWEGRALEEESRQGSLTVTEAGWNSHERFSNSGGSTSRHHIWLQA